MHDIKDTRAIVIVTGCPGSGKTSFAERIKERFPFLVPSAYDELKERYFDEYGFDSLEERAILNGRSLEAYYGSLSETMARGLPILAEYPFNRLIHEERLNDLVSRFSYRALTITLFGDPAVLLERGRSRDCGPRNRGHLLTRYHKDDYSEEDRIPAMTLERFIETNERKNYFLKVGRTVRVDVTSLDSIDYEAVFDEVDRLFRTSP